MKTFYSIILVVTLALFWGACSSDDNDGVAAGAGGNAITGVGGQSGMMTTASGGIGGEAVAGVGVGGSAGSVQPLVDSGAPDGSVTGTGGSVAGTGGAVAGTGGTAPIEAGVDTGVTDTGVTEAGTDSEFEACIATLTDCKLVEMDTAEKMETPCRSMTILPAPLVGGGTYAPPPIEGGPYGSVIEWNEGAGTEFVNPINGAEAGCAATMAFFNEPAVLNNDLRKLRGMDQSLYTIFRPACMREGETYPVITWANGTCGYVHGYAAMLGHLASHGYVVIASNSTYTDTAPTNMVQLRSLDYAAALNADPNSIFYQKLDLGKIGAMGHSQGAMATVSTASDSRVKAVIRWNGGTSNSKPFLFVSGQRDLGAVGASGMESLTNSATQPGAWIYYNQILQTGGSFTGHLVLMQQPERVVDMHLAWWDWQLKGDQNAKSMFVGDNCGLCNRDTEFNYGHNSLLQ